MGSIWFVIWCILTVFQPPNLVTAEEPVCVPGFQSDQRTFSVTRNYLTRGTVLGKVGFTDCTDRRRFLFDTSDKRFVVKTDGVLMVKRAVYLHEGHHDFFIHSWDSQGLKLTIPVSVSMNAADAQVPVLQFPKPGEGLRRRKRDWVIPPLSVTENKRGRYPLKVAQIRSIEDRRRKIFYSITGPGADKPPIHRFTMDRETGNLYVTQPLDREETALYLFEAHAVVEGGGQAEDPMEIIVNVIDQNDNKPYFTVEYNANVAEATAIGTEVVRVEAKDDDEPNTDIQHHSTEVDSINNTENATDPQVPVLQFPRSGGGLRRRKRDWVIPPLSVAENKRGIFPQKVAQIRSNEDKTRKVYYSITGPGADQPPAGRFTMDRETGNLYVTQPLDREETPKYTFLAHAVADGAGQAEDSMEIIVNVIDQNDNKPYFTKEYKENVAEATAIGTEVVRVEAKDDDEPNSDNSDLRYRILNQDPPLPTDNMFEINPVTGSIRVTGSGLDREKYPQYTLTVQTADMAGEGLTGQTKVILTVTDGSSNAPDSSSNVEPNTARVFPAIFFTENNRGPYPIKLIEIRSDEHQKQNLHYSITGPGADQPPVALFTMNRDTGSLYVTQPVDREEVAHYKLQVHVVAESGDHQEVMSVTVKVIDQNDNKPVFSQNTFEGQVAENSVQGSEVIKVEATDSDEPDNANSDIRYRIVRQDPQLPSDNMFEINSVTGAISVAGTGLDREKYPQYTLTVQAADMEGEGLSGQAQVIIKVVESQ